ncbi:MAG: glutaminyl-peptide cyclotransferase [Bacteroidetes bacterium]|nr:MAG: glutaminyl-peptide cyclotransferase [Bacteroidota bacterium]
MNFSIKLYKYLLVIIFFALFLSCGNQTESNHKNEHKLITENNQNNAKQNIQLDIKTSDKNKTEFIIGEEITFLIEQKDTNQIDSVQFFIDNQFLETITILPTKIKWNSKQAKTGKNNFEARVFFKQNKETWKLSFTLISDIEPKGYSYKIVNIFPHDRAAYTQGLVYENGFLYEATGQKGESTLRKVQLGTGEVIQSFTLPKEIFGEGIAIFNEKIIQLSYRAYTGFVYDKKSFSLLMKFNYPKPIEGWGLTNDDKNLIMSDGSHNLYFIDPVSFSQTGKLEVYDNKGPVKRLNELELINGELWANIYTTDRIAKIDLKTGKVLAYIDLTEILPQKDYERDTDVLNGIAYDEKNDRIFVTGKRWPKLFEIKIK